MKRWFLGFVLLIVFAILAVGWMSVAKIESVPDDLRIRQLLADGQKAIMEKDLRATMSCVSRNYRDQNGWTYDILRLQALQAMRSVSHYNVRIDAPTVEFPDSHTAHAQTNVEVDMEFGGMVTSPIRFVVNMELAKERSRHWWIFPVTRWKITSLSDIPLSNLENFTE